MQHMGEEERAYSECAGAGADVLGDGARRPWRLSKGLLTQRPQAKD